MSGDGNAIGNVESLRRLTTDIRGACDHACLHIHIYTYCLSSRAYADRNVVEGFRTQIIQKKLLGSSPVHQVGNCSFLHVKSDNVFVVLVCQVRCSGEQTQTSGVLLTASELHDASIYDNLCRT